MTDPLPATRKRTYRKGKLNYSKAPKYDTLQKRPTAFAKNSYGKMANISRINQYEVEYSNPITRDLIYQKLDPEESKNLVREPSLFGGHSVLKSKTIIQANFNEDGRSSVIVRPSTRLTISKTAIAHLNDEAQTPLKFALPTTNNTQGPYLNHPLSLYQGERFYSSVPLKMSNNFMVYPSNIISSVNSGPGEETVYTFRIQSANVDQDEWDAIPQNASIMSIASFINTDLPFGTVYSTIKVASSALPDGIAIRNNQVFSSNQVLTNISKIEWLNLFPAFNILQSYQMTLSISFISPQGSMQIPGYCFHRFTSNAPALGSVVEFVAPQNHSFHEYMDMNDGESLAKNSSHQSVIAQSLLVTSQNSSDTDQGAVATARIPGGRRPGGLFTPGTTGAPDWYSFISSLPYNSYDGPASKGCYTWWLGQDVESSQFKTSNFSPISAKEDNYMMAVIDAKSQTSSYRIKVVTIVAFVSNSPSFEQRVAPMVPEYPLAIQLLGLCQSSYENGTHGQQLKKYLSDAAKALYHKTGQIMRDPKTYSTIGNAILKYGPMAASALGKAALTGVAFL